jgi:hypothetical protein
MSVVHINSPTPTQVIVQVIPTRCRVWRDLKSGRAPRTIARAKAKAALALIWPWVRAVRVVACYDWYEPSIVFEAYRR